MQPKLKKVLDAIQEFGDGFLDIGEAERILNAMTNKVYQSSHEYDILFQALGDMQTRIELDKEAEALDLEKMEADSEHAQNRRIYGYAK